MLSFCSCTSMEIALLWVAVPGNAVPGNEMPASKWLAGWEVWGPWHLSHCLCSWLAVALWCPVTLPENACPHFPCTLDWQLQNTKLLAAAKFLLLSAVGAHSLLYKEWFPTRLLQSCPFWKPSGFGHRLARTSPLFYHPRFSSRETAAPWNCGRKEARAAPLTGSSPSSAAEYMQRSKRGSVGASRICSPFVASALLKLEREPCLQAKQKIEQCQQPVLGFFLHFSHSPDPDEGVQHEQQASNKSVEQNHQLHPGPVPLHSPHTQAQCLLGAQRSCPGNHGKACTTQARSSFLSHLHKGAHYNKKETVLPLPQTSWKLFGEKKKKRSSRFQAVVLCSALCSSDHTEQERLLHVPSLSSQGLKAGETAVSPSSHFLPSSVLISYISSKETKRKKHY